MRVFPVLISVALLIGCVHAAPPRDSFEVDTLPTEQGDLEITFIGHGTLMFRHTGKVIHVDPVSRYADYAAMPKADLILVTHEHFDHLDPTAIAKITKAETKIVLTAICHEKLGQGEVMKNGDAREILGFTIEAVPAYNVVHERSPGKPFHPKGAGNGYVITFGDQRVYVAGDTEDIPEMADLKRIDIAFLPMNLPYTMSPTMAAKAARACKPAILYPYHFGKTDTSQLIELLKNEPDIEIRIRKLE